MLQDSVISEPVAVPEEAVQPAAAHEPTPYEVINALPADATPAQQDSAIQAVFHPRTVNYSDRPDTLHLPGHDIGRSVFSADLPTYYRESFFSADILFHPELKGGRYGMAGDPVPYTLRGDNVVSLIFIVSFILGLVAFRMSSGFIYRQAKDFFYVSHSGPTFASETSSEVRFQFFLVVVGAFMLSIFLYLYALSSVGATFVVSQYQLMAVYLAVLFGYIVLKYVGCTVVDSVFFGRRSHLAWVKSQLFVLAVCGVLVAPVVLLQVFFDLSVQKAAIGLLAIFVLSKILLFYKCFAIFSGRIGAFLQIFLYFCALEIVPPVTLWGCLLWISNCLKVNY